MPFCPTWKLSLSFRRSMSKNRFKKKKAIRNTLAQLTIKKIKGQYHDDELFRRIDSSGIRVRHKVLSLVFEELKNVLLKQSLSSPITPIQALDKIISLHKEGGRGHRPPSKRIGLAYTEFNNSRNSNFTEIQPTNNIASLMNSLPFADKSTIINKTIEILQRELEL